MNTKRRAAKIGMDFTLTREEFLEMMAQAKGQCTVSGIRFRRINITRTHMRQPYYPSIDRIDNTKGYSKENCRIVCLAVNLAMNGWGPSVLYEIAKALAGKERRMKKLKTPEKPQLNICFIE